MTEETPDTTEPYGHLVSYANHFMSTPATIQDTILIRVDPIDWFARRRMEIKHLRGYISVEYIPGDDELSTTGRNPYRNTPSPYRQYIPGLHATVPQDYGRLVLLQSWPLTKEKYHRLLAAGVFEEPTHP